MNMTQHDWRRIDTRDLVEELSDLTDTLPDVDDIDSTRSDPEHAETWERMNAISALFEEISSYAGDSPEDGIFLIADSEFTDAMIELVEDIGDLPNGMPSYIVVDWDATAENLKADYTSVEFEGVTYWYR